MKKIFLILITIFAFCNSVFAECPGNKFDPNKFNQELEAAITAEARLTPQEAQAFFPLFWEMQNKQRALFHKQRQNHKLQPADEEAALKLIKDIDATEIEIKKVQQCYHARFLKILPATKVFLCIKAEEKYNRDIMRRIAEKHNTGKPGPRSPQPQNKRN